ncbi:MAG: hypothetical protein LBN11_02955 [Tannerella sp.]|nr:hypothetical protein [Tannerella sp.]
MRKSIKPLVTGVSIAVIVALCNCSRKERVSEVRTIDFAEGDLIFRRGLGAKSEAVLRVDTAGIYSHSGIVVKQDSVFMVIHITPGERENGETEDRIKMETPETFFSAERAQRGAVYRLKDSLNISLEAARQAIRLWRKGVLFDHDYVLEDSTKMYCTELVWYAYLLAGKDITDGSRSEIVNVPLFSGIYIFPSDIYNNKQCSLIYKF